MKIKEVNKSNILIPEFNGNKNLPESEQIIISIKEFPSVTDVKSFKIFKTDSNNNVGISYNDSILITKCVGSIKGLFVGDKAIENASQLLDSKSIALDSLISEIRNYLIDDGDVLSLGESKA